PADEQTTAPPAEAINTDTGQQGPSETVPYSRFKEVNDQLRSYKTLEDEHGYDADSLRQLAEWADRFDQDPVQSWLSVGAQLEGLSPSVGAAIQSAIQGGASQPATGQTPQTPSYPEGNQDQEEDTPEWARELMSRVDRMEQSDVQ